MSRGFYARLLGFQGFNPGVEDNTPPRQKADIEAARRMRDGILKGLAFIEGRARTQQTADFYREKTDGELRRLDEICDPSDSPFSAPR